MPLMREDSPSPAPANGPEPGSDAILAREQGLSLLAKANRWMIGLAVLAAAALSGLTAHAFHAKAAGRHPASGTASQAAGTSSGAGNQSAPLQAPASAPTVAAPAPAPVGPVVSGGS
jgi:hypothetical protein